MAAPAIPSRLPPICSGECRERTFCVHSKALTSSAKRSRAPDRKNAAYVTRMEAPTGSNVSQPRQVRGRCQRNQHEQCACPKPDSAVALVHQACGARARDRHARQRGSGGCSQQEVVQRPQDARQEVAAVQAAIAAMHGAAHAQAQGDNAGGVDQDWDGHDLSGSQRGTAEKVDQKRAGRSFGKRLFGYPSVANSTIQTRGDSSQGSASQPISPLASRRTRVSIRVGSDSSSFTR